MEEVVGSPANTAVAPSDYAQLFDEWFDFVRGLCRKAGIREDEDVASQILVRFYERDFLSEFDPDREFDRAGVKRKARFSTFLGAFTQRYLLHYRERQGVRDHREPLRCDQPTASGTLWVELHAPAYYEPDFENIEEEHLVCLIRERLEARSLRGRRKDIPLMFDVMVDQIRSFGRVNIQALAKAMGISDTAASSWLEVVREETRAVVAATS